MTKKHERFCISCGITGFKKEELIEGLCFNCYKLKNPLIKLKKAPILQICKNCHSIKIMNEWTNTDPQDFYQQCKLLLNQNFNNYFEIKPETKFNLKFVDVPSVQDIIKFNSIQFEVNINHKYRNIIELTDTQRYSVKIKIGICEICKNFRSSVYKAKIRIIAKKRKITDNEIDEIIDLIKNSANIYRDPNFYILPPNISKSELIFRVSSINYARTVSNQLKQKFGAVLRESFKFVDREKKRSKKQNLNILVKLLPFFMRDIIIYNNNLLYVISIQDNIISCLDFKSKEIKKYKTKQLINAERYLDKSKLEKYMVTALYEDVIQVMNLKTFQTFEVNYASYLKNIREGVEIYGFREGDKLNLIPFNIQGQDAKND